MADELVGRGIIEIVGESSQFSAAMAEVRRTAGTTEEAVVKSAGKMGQAFEQPGKTVPESFGKIDNVTKRFITSVEREIATLSLSRDAFRAWEAQAKGIPESVYTPYIAKLNEARQAQEAATNAQVAANGVLRKGATEFNEYGRSAKQTTAALRQVPAQLTDIVVSLQGGQAPLTVLLQQGGQLKDVFGGIRPAAAALGGELLNLARNPFVVVGAALATLAFGYFKGSQEGDKFRLSLISTGNQIGLTSAQLQQYAAAVDQVASTQSLASEVITKFVSTNQVSAQSIETVTLATVRAQELLGVTVDDTVAKFAELGKDPVQASIKLNQETGFLTFALFEQIKALQAQGRATEAADLAQRAFAETLNQRTGQIEANLGSIERGWLSVKRAINEAKDALFAIGRVQPIGSTVTEDQVVAQVRRASPFASDAEIAAVRERFRSERESLKVLESRSALRASEASIDAKLNEAAIRASQAVDARATRALTKQQQLNKELRAYRNELDAIRLLNPNDARLRPENVSAVEANIREQFRERGGSGRRPTAVTDDAATRRLQQLRESEAALRLELSTTDKLVGAQRDLAEFNQLIADLKEKRILTADQKSLLAAQDSIRAQLQNNIGLQQAIKLRDDAAKNEEQREARLQRLRVRGAQIELAAEDAARARREQSEDRLGVFGQGPQAREQLASQIAIQRQFQRFQDQLRNATSPDLLGSDEFNTRRQIIADGLARALEDNRIYFEQLRGLQSNWLNGAKEAYSKYVDDTRDVAGQTERLFTRSFQAAEDALATFVRTGKINFRSLADVIISELVRIYAKQQIAKLSSGGNFLSFLGNIATLISGGGVTGDYNALGRLEAGRAIGGPVSSGRMYPVLENGPELLNMQNRTYLMTGDQSGRVTPLSAGGAMGGGGRGVKVTVVNTGTPQKVVSTRQMSDDEIVLMVQDAASSARRGAVADVRSQIRNPNGGVSTDLRSRFALQRNT